MHGIGIWNSGLRWGDKGEAREAAAELEELGYTALWIPDTGGRVFEAVELLLDATTRLTVATGVLNLWKHDAAETAAEHHRLVETYGDRFLLGIGVSHESIVDSEDQKIYSQPLRAMQRYLDELDAAPVPLPVGSRALAALGPKMLALAAERAAGVHPYNVTPEHTAAAREAVGPEKLVLPEQAVILTNDATKAREVGRQYLQLYSGMPNYVNNWRRLGFTDEDFHDGGSDRLVDAIVAWGDLSDIKARVEAHLLAGADHVCIQVIAEPSELPRDAWRELSACLNR